MDIHEELKAIQNSLKHLAEVAASHDESFRTIARTFQTELKTVQNLERIASAHEARLARLEKRK